ncbi:MAG: GNAT family N-acetyltransferase [Candidatus Dadabacteria bacterium]|jgi:putative hemolysin|nr:GNAT family N-acetyltransferase [Candidatus Dadabacteria bacterium]
MREKKITSLKNTVTGSNVLRSAFKWKLRQFRTKVPINIESNRFVIKTVENMSELEKALDLRYEVFYRETLNKDNFTRTDIDKFDSICDHLIILDKKQNMVIGTYRFISSTFSDKFYSESEFDIEQVKNAPGVKLELGRACVHKDYRNGTGIALLWKGLTEYFRTIKAKYLFGCSSIGTTNVVEISLIYKYIKELYLSPEDFRVFPKEKHRIKELDHYISAFDKFGIKTESIEEFIPPLLKSYLKAGSVICGEPAIDMKFKCADFFTVLDLELLSKSFEKRYKGAND